MLKGEVRINDDLIGEWFATRVEKVVWNKDWHVYKCHVQDRDLAGYPRVADFQVTHGEHEGALVLAYKVLQAAAVPGVMRRVERDT